MIRRYWRRIVRRFRPTPDVASFTPLPAHTPGDTFTMAQMLKPTRTRKSSGARSHTLARRAIVSGLLSTPKGKREPIQYVDDEGNVVASLGSGVIFDPATLNDESIGAPRPLSRNSVRTMIYGAAKDAGVTVSVHDWSDGAFAIVLK